MMRKEWGFWDCSQIIKKIDLNERGNVAKDEMFQIFQIILDEIWNYAFEIDSFTFLSLLLNSKTILTESLWKKMRENFFIDFFII